MQKRQGQWTVKRSVYRYSRKDKLDIWETGNENADHKWMEVSHNCLFNCKALKAIIMLHYETKKHFHSFTARLLRKTTGFETNHNRLAAAAHSVIDKASHKCPYECRNQHNRQPNSRQHSIHMPC